MRLLASTVLDIITAIEERRPGTTVVLTTITPILTGTIDADWVRPCNALLRDEVAPNATAAGVNTVFCDVYADIDPQQHLVKLTL